MGKKPKRQFTGAGFKWILAGDAVQLKRDLHGELENYLEDVISRITQLCQTTKLSSAILVDILETAKPLRELTMIPTEDLDLLAIQNHMKDLLARIEHTYGTLDLYQVLIPVETSAILAHARVRWIIDVNSVLSEFYTKGPIPSARDYLEYESETLERIAAEFEVRIPWFRGRRVVTQRGYHAMSVHLVSDPLTLDKGARPALDALHEELRQFLAWELDKMPCKVYFRTRAHRNLIFVQVSRDFGHL